MGFKKWPTWLKGGISSVLVVILVYSFYRFVHLPFYGDSMWILFLLFPGAIAVFPLTNKCLLSCFMAPPNCVSQCPIGQNTYQTILIISSLVAWFIIGAIIGLVVGKIKSRKQEPVSNEQVA